MRELEAAGLQVAVQREAFPETAFYDVGAAVYYLRAIPWQIPDFDPARNRDRLAAIHDLIQAHGQRPRFYVEAIKPGCASTDPSVKTP